MKNTKSITLVYASHDGQTQKISQTLQTHLHEAGIACTLVKADECSQQILTDSEILVFGAPIRYGKHLPVMTTLLQQHHELLNHKTTAFFSVNLTARKANRNTPETSNYVKKLFAQLDWQPDEADVFAGMLNYPQYRFFDKLMIRFIMWLTKGPTAADTVHEFTDWQRVASFAKRLAQLTQR